MAIPRRFAIFRGVAPPKRSRSVGAQSLTAKSTGMDKREKEGLNAIAKAVAQCKPPVIVVEMLRNFGDVLHSSVVIRHLRKTQPETSVVWAIDLKYVREFEMFTVEEMGPHKIAALPDLPPHPADGQYRISWVNGAAKLPGVVSAIGCGVYPWGCPKGCKSIVDAVLANAKIEKLAVPRRPWVPLSREDNLWAEKFIEERDLKNFVSLEYVSYSLQPKPVGWYKDLVAGIPFPVVAIAGAKEPPVEGSVDARGCTYRQAKALIARSKVFVGRGSGLSVLAASDGCEQKVVDLVGLNLSMADIGYRGVGDRHRSLPDAPVEDVVRAVTDFMVSP